MTVLCQTCAGSEQDQRGCLLAAHYTTSDKDQQQKALRQTTAKVVKAGKFKKGTSEEARQCSKPKGSSSTKCLRITVKSIAQVLR